MQAPISSYRDSQSVIFAVARKPSLPPSSRVLPQQPVSTSYSTPFRPCDYSAARPPLPAVPAVALGRGGLAFETAEPIPASSRPLLRRRRGRRAGGPEPAGGPGEGQQHDDNGHAPPTTRVWLSGSSSAPPIEPPAAASSSSMAESPSIVRLRRVHVGRAARRRAEMAAHSSLHRIRARSPPGINPALGHNTVMAQR